MLWEKNVRGVGFHSLTIYNCPILDNNRLHFLMGNRLAQTTKEGLSYPLILTWVPRACPGTPFLNLTLTSPLLP